MLSDAEYVEKVGTVCPKCQGDDITGGSVTIDGGGANQHIYCGNCDFEWFDLYRLEGYFNVEESC